MSKHFIVVAAGAVANAPDDDDAPLVRPLLPSR